MEHLLPSNLVNEGIPRASGTLNRAQRLKSSQGHCFEPDCQVLLPISAATLGRFPHLRLGVLMYNYDNISAGNGSHSRKLNKRDLT